MLNACCTASGSVKYNSGKLNVNRLNSSVVSLVSPQPDEAGAAGLSRDEYDDANTIGMSHRSYCTGFYVSETEIMTAAHCVARYIEVMTPFGPEEMMTKDSPIGDFKKIVTYKTYLDDGAMKTYSLYYVTKYNDVTDIAILKILSNQKKDPNQVILSFGKNPKQGDHVSVVGHPAGLMWTLTEGIVSYGYRNLSMEDGMFPTTQVSAGIYFGNSGGPLFDDQGNVIGVVSRIVVPHLGLCSHVTAMKQIFNQK